MATERNETIDPVTGEVIWSEVVEAPDPEPVPRTALDIIAGLDPDTAAAAVAAGAGLVAKAGDLWDALTEISHQNTARPAIEVITGIALSAALASEPLT